MMGMLQQLQQSDPTKYQQVTQQIAANLQNAAQTAETDGNSTAAAQLSKLASDFNSASQSGQLPNIQDLAQAIGGGHHHHHHAHAASVDADGNSSANNGSTGTPTSSVSHALNQFLSLFQSKFYPERRAESSHDYYEYAVHRRDQRLLITETIPNSQECRSLHSVP
jgi:hypothetical protein